MGRWVRAALGVVLLAAVACTGDDDSEDAAPRSTLPPLRVGGIVTTDAWLDGRGVQNLRSAAPTPTRYISGGDLGVMVLAPDGGDETSPDAVVVSPAFTHPGDGELPNAGEELGALATIYPGVPCGARTVVAQADSGPVRVASRGVSAAELARIGEQVQLGADGNVALVEPVDGWHEVGRLPADWRSPGDGSVGLLAIDEAGPDAFIYARIEVLARRIDASMAAALRALLCEDPNASLLTAATFVPADFSAHEARTIELPGGATARAGVIANTSAVVFTDDRLLEFFPQMGGTDADELLGRLIAGFTVVEQPEFDAAAAEIDRERGDEAMREWLAALPGSQQAIADGMLLGNRWLLTTAMHPLDDVPVVCATVVRSAAGYLASPSPGISGNCVLDELAAPDPRLGFDGPTFAFAEVPVDAASAEVTGDFGVGASELVTDSRGRRYVIFTLPDEAGGFATGSGLSNDALNLSFPGGAVMNLTVRDATGAIVAEDAIGA